MINMKETISVIQIHVPDRIHQVARIRAVERRSTLKDYIIELILEDVSRQQQAPKDPENA